MFPALWLVFVGLSSLGWAARDYDSPTDWIVHSEDEELNLVGLDQDSVDNGESWVDRDSSAEGRSYWIETLVFADHTVEQRFSNRSEATKYVVTLIQMTNNLFHHPSLGVNLSLVIRDIVWVTESESNELLWGASLVRSVHRFCSWALGQYYVRYNYDHALFLSRNIVQAAGISPLRQMCRMQYSCTLAEDSGFFSAYPIAHEMMHSLGVEHDGEGNSCDRSGLTGNIMAPLILSAGHNHHWSDCTRLVLQSGLEAHKFTCLQDFPILKSEFLKIEPPGWSWTLDQQCFILSGSNASKHCPGVEEHACQELWCSVTGKKNHCDRMLNHGLLDGTPCGKGKECSLGKCILVKVKENQNDEWSPFTAWTACSRNCGIGTRFRVRECQKLSPEGTPECSGSSIEYELCHASSATECSRFVDYREEQCARFNGFKLRGVYHTWLPYLYPENPCHLGCISKQNGQILDASIAVRDSTLCSYDDPDSRCIQSVCVKFDCLGVVNGNATRDRCGVCQGDNSTCNVFEHQINRSLKLHSTSRLIYIIPRLARHILIRQTSGNHSFGLFDMAYFQTLISSDDFESARTIHRVYYATQFTFERQSGAFQIHATGPVYGDVAIEARNREYPEESVPLTIDISYVMPTRT